MKRYLICAVLVVFFVLNGIAQTALSGNWTDGFWQMKTDWGNKQFKNSKL